MSINKIKEHFIENYIEEIADNFSGDTISYHAARIRAILKQAIETAYQWNNMKKNIKDYLL